MNTVKNIELVTIELNLYGNVIAKARNLLCLPPKSSDFTVIFVVAAGKSTCVRERQRQEKKKMRQLKVTRSNANRSGVQELLKQTATFVVIFSVTFSIAVNLDVMYYDAVKALKHLNTFNWFRDNDICTKSLNFSELSILFKNQLTGQDHVLHDFKSVLETINGNVISIALVGGTGVGKTTFVRLFQTIFPWKNNIHFHVWENNISHAKNLAKLRKWTKQLIKCGQNLIIIDGLPTVALNHILDFDRQLHLNFESYKITAIYVFRILKMNEIDKANYESTKKTFENLRNIKTIYFRELNDSDVRNCIDLECKMLNITLNEDDIAAIMQMINVERAGCKNVHSKIMLFVNKS